MQAYSVNLDNTHTNAVLTSEQKAENVSNINGAPNISNLLTDYGSLEKLYEGLTVGNGPGQVSVGQKNYVWRAMQKLKNPNTPSSELQGGTYSTPTSGNVPYMSVGVDGERITFDGATLKQYTNNPNAAVQVIDNWTGFVNTAVSDIVYDKNYPSRF